MNMKYPTVDILGSAPHLVDIPDITRQMDKWIEEYTPSGRCRQIVNTGFHGLSEASRSAKIKKIYREADLWIPDGISFKIIAQLKGYQSAKRLAGIDFVRAFLDIANEKGYRSFFYGDTKDTLKKLEQNVGHRYSGHHVVGTFSPPFRQMSKAEDEDIVRMINQARPDVLWVALGCPKQDIWIYEHKNRLQVPLAVGVGAILKFLAGTVKRSPEWVAKSGLEWLWRLGKEPGKLWRRDLIDGPQFFWRVLLELAGVARQRQK